MKYMPLVDLDGKALSGTERAGCCRDSTRLARDLETSGRHLDALQRRPTSTATSVRVRNEKRLVTDEPFAETREQLGGSYLSDAGDLDEAIGIAARVPVALMGTIEIRPVL
jgi:hypothetical protein